MPKKKNLPKISSDGARVWGTKRLQTMPPQRTRSWDRGRYVLTFYQAFLFFVLICPPQCNSPSATCPSPGVPTPVTTLSSRRARSLTLYDPPWGPYGGPCLICPARPQGPPPSQLSWCPTSETAPTASSHLGPTSVPPVRLILPSHLPPQDRGGFRGSSVAALSPNAATQRPAARRGTAPAASPLQAGGDGGGGGGADGGYEGREAGAGRGLGWLASSAAAGPRGQNR